MADVIILGTICAYQGIRPNKVSNSLCEHWPCDSVYWFRSCSTSTPASLLPISPSALKYRPQKAGEVVHEIRVHARDAATLSSSALGVLTNSFVRMQGMQRTPAIAAWAGDCQHPPLHSKFRIKKDQVLRASSRALRLEIGYWCTSLMRISATSGERSFSH